MKKKLLIAIIISSCLAAGCSADTPLISETVASSDETTTVFSEEVSEVDNNLDPGFEGLWSRTNVSSSLWAQINISEINGDTMHVMGTFQYYYHLGDIDAYASFISENEAVISQQDIDPTAVGIVTDEEVLLNNGTSARHISCTVPTDTAGYDILITANGQMYLDINGEIYTDDLSFTGDVIPEFTAE